MSRDELIAAGAITAQQGAAFLGVSLRTWQNLEARGALPTYRLPSIGRFVRYDGATLATYGTAPDLRTRATRHTPNRTTERQQVAGERCRCRTVCRFLRGHQGSALAGCVRRAARFAR